MNKQEKPNWLFSERAVTRCILMLIVVSGINLYMVSKVSDVFYPSIEKVNKNFAVMHERLNRLENKVLN